METVWTFAVRCSLPWYNMMYYLNVVADNQVCPGTVWYVQALQFLDMVVSAFFAWKTLRSSGVNAMTLKWVRVITEWLLCL